MPLWKDITDITETWRAEAECLTDATGRMRAMLPGALDPEWLMYLDTQAATLVDHADVIDAAVAQYPPGGGGEE